MKKHPSEPEVPRASGDTLRRAIITALESGPLTARDLSAEVHIPEKEVYDHLEHLRRTLTVQGRRLIVAPSECKKCGFVFEKRERLTRPGKCPVCRGESISAPRYSVPRS